jgi:DHA2 family multidrug resistance protein
MSSGGAEARPDLSPPRELDPFNKLMITASIMTATVMNALDMTIANVALPHIQGSISASQDQATWVLTSYIVTAAIMTPLTGALSTRLGAKRVFQIAVAGFTVASALCGLAQNLFEIVAFRVLQGAFGAPLIPLAQAVLFDINPPHKQGQAMAVWGMASMLGPIMGPVLGGYLTDHLSWRWVFYINLPFGIASFVGITLFIREQTRKRGQNFDLLGYSFLAVGVGAIQMMLDRGQQQDWFSSPEIWIELGIGLVAFYLCVVHTLTARAPFIKREVVFDTNFSTASVFSIIIGLLMFSTTALLPPMIEVLLGYPVTEAGMVLAPRGFGTLISFFFVGRLVTVMDNRLIMMAGIGILAASMNQMTHFDLLMDSRPIIVSGVLQGLGMGLLFVPLSTLAFSTLSPTLRTEGAGLFTLVRNVGSSVGISILSATQIRAMATARSELAEHVRVDNPAFAMRPVPIDPTNPATLAGLEGQISRQAAMIAYIDAFKLIMMICFVAIPLLIFLRVPKKGPREPSDPHLAVE